MNDAALEARTLLWEWLIEAEDPDFEQRGWKLARLDGMILACERAGVLSAEEVRGWRAIAAGDVRPASPTTDRVATEQQLGVLLAAIRPMSRDLDPDGLRASRRQDGALDALEAAGVLTGEEAAAWRKRALEAQAPWLDRDDIEQFAGHKGMYAIGVPARTPEEEAADAAADRELEAITRRGELRCVRTCRTPARREGLAVLAVVVRTEATDVLFHHVGPPQGAYQGALADLAAFDADIQALVPPALIDDVGTRYEPATPRPVRSRGNGGMPDPARPRVITGVWRYSPTAPDAAGRFTATLGETRWTLE